MKGEHLRNPPKLATRLLKGLLKDELLEEVIGDMKENYEYLRKSSSNSNANFNYWYQTINYLRPFAIRDDLMNNLNPFFMWRHNLVITLRKFKRNKTSFFINLLGLSSALACALLIYMWSHDEMSVDRFHEKDDYLYQVMFNLDLPSGTFTGEETPVPLAQSMREEIPGVEYSTTINDFFNWGKKKGTLSYDEQKLEVQGIHADEDFLNVFSYPLLEGNRQQILKNKNSLLIARSVAEKLFGKTANIVGKSIRWNHVAYDGDFQIDGVFEDPPNNATEQFEVVLHLSNLIDNDQWANRWRGCYGKTYFTTIPTADIQSIRDRLATTMEAKCEQCTGTSLFPYKYSDKYLHGDFVNGHESGKGRHLYVKYFLLIALFLLLIASINFMNLSTAEAALKMKEIGVRKTIGATRRSLILQLQSESLLLTLFALVGAIALVTIFLPQFNVISGKNLQVSDAKKFFFGFLAIAVITGIISGSYPAFYLSRFRPVDVLKGKLQGLLGDIWVRKGLVIIQFALSLVFIVGLIVINRQIEFSQTKDMGYERDNIVSFAWKGELYDQWNGLDDEGNSNEKYFAFINGLSNIPGVIHATQMNGNLLDNVIGQSGIRLSDDPSSETFNAKSPVVSYDFFKTFGIELLDGRTFSRDRNDSYFSTVMVNEAAASMLGFENPVGQKIRMNGENEIIGVVKDFHYGSLYNGVEPFIFRFNKYQGNIYVKIDESQVQQSLIAIEEFYQEFLPGQSLDYSFLDDDYQLQYEADLRLSSLSKYFAVLAIIISCLGLFGLARFMTQRRKKEIGIRKVLGSSVISVVSLLGKDFTRTVTMSLLISIPLSYFITKNWLARFAYSIDLEWWFFAVPAVTIILLAWITVGTQTLRAAQLDPVDTLKSE